jgi:hypothetical protein
MSWRRAGHGSLEIGGQIVNPPNKLGCRGMVLKGPISVLVFLALVPVFILSNYWSKRRYRPPRKQALQKASIGPGMLVLATWVYVVRDKRFMISRGQGMKRIVVMGGAGFVGSNLVERL